MFEEIVFMNWNVAEIIGVAALFVVGIIYLIMHGQLPLPPFLRLSINELVEKQIIDDEFDGVSLLRWMKKNRRDDKVKVVVVKPTPTWLKKLNLRDAEKIDPEKNLLAYMVDDNGKLLSMQLFTFSSISQKMKEKFSTTGEMVMTT